MYHIKKPRSERGFFVRVSLKQPLIRILLIRFYKRRFRTSRRSTPEIQDGSRNKEDRREKDGGEGKHVTLRRTYGNPLKISGCPCAVRMNKTVPAANAVVSRAAACESFKPHSDGIARSFPLFRCRHSTEIDKGTFFVIIGRIGVKRG